MKKVIYTCITNHYDELRKDCAISDGYDYICFTDDLTIENGIWKLMPIPENLKYLPYNRQQRYIKLHPHEVLPDYDFSIYIDGCIVVKQDVNSYIKTILEKDIDIYVPLHPCRNCIYKEAEQCIEWELDTKEHILPQINKYKEEGFPEHYGLVQSNILIRYHNENECKNLMSLWWNIINNGSHRDQLSFNYCIWKLQYNKIKFLNTETCNNEYFKWEWNHGK